MDEVVEAIEKYQGLVPLVYDIETMSLDEARPQDMPYAVYLKREADKVIAEKADELRATKRALWLARAERAKNEARYRNAIINYEAAYMTEEKYFFIVDKVQNWKLAERKCRAYADKFKEEQ